MIHPEDGYAFGPKISYVSGSCPFQGKEIEVSEYARDVEKGIHYYISRCGCAWPGTNLQYLEMLYESRNH